MTAERLSLSLNGTSQYAEITSGVLTHSADFTVMFWFRPTNSNGASIYRTTWSGNTVNHSVLAKVDESFQLKVIAVNAGTIVSGSAATALEVGRWYHLALTQNADDLTLYLDGAEYDSITQTASTRSASTKMALGNDPSSYAEPFGGRFYGAKAWTRALSLAEIQTELPSIPAVSTASIYGEWQSADTDTSGNGNDWTLVGSPSFSEDTPFDRMRSGSLSLSGGAYAQITGGAIDHSQDLCISGWVRVPNTVVATGHVFRTQNVGGNILLLQWKTTNFLELQGLLSGATIYVASGTLSLGQWYHWAVVISGDTHTLYVDGVPVDSDTQATASRSSNSGIAFGADYNGAEPLECDLYALKAWQRALTQTELEIEMQSVEPVVLESLYAYWPHVAEDLSGNQNSPVIIGTETYTDAPPIPLGTAAPQLVPIETPAAIATTTGDTAVSFDRSSSEHLTITSDVLSHQSDYTVAGWFRRDETASVPQGMFHIGANADEWNNSDTVELSDTNWRLFAYAGGVGQQGTNAISGSYGDWLHVAIVRSGSDCSLIVDGSLIRTVTQAQSSAAVVMRLAKSYGLYIAGLGYKHWKAWSRALSYDELIAESQQGSPADATDLYAYWPFDDGDVTDHSGNGHDWTIQNGSSVIEGPGVPLGTSIAELGYTPVATGGGVTTGAAVGLLGTASATATQSIPATASAVGLLATASATATQTQTATGAAIGLIGVGAASGAQSQSSSAAAVGLLATATGVGTQSHGATATSVGLVAVAAGTATQTHTASATAIGLLGVGAGVGAQDGATIAAAVGLLGTATGAGNQSIPIIAAATGLLATAAGVGAVTIPASATAIGLLGIGEALVTQPTNQGAGIGLLGVASATAFQPASATCAGVGLLASASCVAYQTGEIELPRPQWAVPYRKDEKRPRFHWVQRKWL